MNNKPSAWSQTLREMLIRHPPHSKRSAKCGYPRPEDVVVTKLLRNDAQRWLPVLALAGAEPADICAGGHKGTHEGFVVDTVGSDDGVETAGGRVL